MIHDQGIFIQSQERFGGIAPFINQCKSEWLNLNKMWKKAKENDKNYRS